MNPTDPKELSLTELFHLIWQRRWLIIRLVAAAAVLSAIVALIMPNWYKATAVIMPPSQKNMPFGAGGLLSQFGFGGLLGGDENSDRFIAILNSRSLMKQVAQRYHLQETYELETMEKTLKAMEDNYAIDIGEENQIVIDFWDKDQERVADISNYIVYCLDSLNINFNTNDATYSRDFIGTRLQLVLDSLLYLEKELGGFMEKEGVLLLEEQVKEGIAAAGELKALILTKEVTLAVARKSVTANDPNIQRIQYEIESLRQKYRELYAGSEDDRLFPAFNKIPSLELTSIRLQRKAKYFLKILEFLAPQYEQAKIEAAKSIPTLQILDPATRPEKKDRPRRAKIVLIAMILTFSLGVLYAYFMGRWELLKETDPS